jgi:hypothetical protein
MWHELKASPGKRAPGPDRLPMLGGLADALAIHHERLFAFENHVPDPVIWLCSLAR